MASLRKRRGRWQVQVRVTGCLPASRTFDLKSDALIWAREQERKAQLGELHAAAVGAPDVTFGQLLERYRDERISKKRCAEFETYMVDAVARQPIASLPINYLSPSHIADYRDERLRAVGPDIVRREFGILQNAIEVARLDWGVPIRENPFKLVRKPAAGKPRDRRLNTEELAILLEKCGGGTNRYLRPLILLAVETAMRRGEILGLRWQDVNAEARTAFIPLTKNGHPRTIPLTPKAIDVLQGIPRNGDRVFSVAPNAVRLAWERLCRRAKVEDLHFHDLRHEAISRFFERGLTVPEVALISGHRDPRMLFRYTHLRAEDVAKKLA